jgi:hypothetical protein
VVKWLIGSAWIPVSCGGRSEGRVKKREREKGKGKRKRRREARERVRESE